MNRVAREASWSYRVVKDRTCMTSYMSKKITLSKYMTKIVAPFSTNDMSNIYMSKHLTKNDILCPGLLVFNQTYVKGEYLFDQ